MASLRPLPPTPDPRPTNASSTYPASTALSSGPSSSVPPTRTPTPRPLPPLPTSSLTSQAAPNASHPNAGASGPFENPLHNPVLAPFLSSLQHMVQMLNPGEDPGIDVYLNLKTGGGAAVRRGFEEAALDKRPGVGLHGMINVSQWLRTGQPTEFIHLVDWADDVEDEDGENKFGHRDVPMMSVVRTLANAEDEVRIERLRRWQEVAGKENEQRKGAQKGKDKQKGQGEDDDVETLRVLGEDEHESEKSMPDQDNDAGSEPVTLSSLMGSMYDDNTLLTQLAYVADSLRSQPPRMQQAGNPHLEFQPAGLDLVASMETQPEDVNPPLDDDYRPACSNPGCENPAEYYCPKCYYCPWDFVPDGKVPSFCSLDCEAKFNSKDTVHKPICKRRQRRIRLDRAVFFIKAIWFQRQELARGSKMLKVKGWKERKEGEFHAGSQEPVHVHYEAEEPDLIGEKPLYGVHQCFGNDEEWHERANELRFVLGGTGQDEFLAVWPWIVDRILSETVYDPEDKKRVQPDITVFFGRHWPEPREVYNVHGTNKPVLEDIWSDHPYLQIRLGDEVFAISVVGLVMPWLGFGGHIAKVDRSEPFGVASRIFMEQHVNSAGKVDPAYSKQLTRWANGSDVVEFLDKILDKPLQLWEQQWFLRQAFAVDEPADHRALCYHLTIKLRDELKGHIANMNADDIAADAQGKPPPVRRVKVWGKETGQRFAQPHIFRVGVDSKSVRKGKEGVVKEKWLVARRRPKK